MAWPTEIHLWAAVSSPPEGCESARYFLFHGDQVLRWPDREDHWEPLPRQVWESGAWDIASMHCIGVSGAEALFAVDLRSAGSGLQFCGLRDLFGIAESAHFAMAGRASQIIAWHRTHQFCGRCGAPTSESERGRAKYCPSCRLSFYPRLSPSIIVLVTRGEEMLLARNVRWPAGRYSTLAGFVEPGETVEEALHREVHEEVGIEVTNLRYQGSQPWPFPNSLMVGFHADYGAGEIRLQREEIADARWFHFSALPEIPGRTAISRWLIDAYVEEVSG